MGGGHNPEQLPQQADFGIVTALRDELIALRAALGATEEVLLGDRDIRYYYRSRVKCQDGSEVAVVCACANDMGQKPAMNLTRDLIARNGGGSGMASSPVISSRNLRECLR